MGSDAAPPLALPTASTSGDAAAGPAASSQEFEYVPPPYFDASSCVPKWLQHLIADTFSFVMIHYNFWTVPFVAFFYYLYQVRLKVLAPMTDRNRELGSLT